MALTIIRRQVVDMLADIRQRLKEAEHRVSARAYRERRREDVLEATLREIDTASAGASERLLRCVSEEIFNLCLCTSSWMAGRRRGAVTGESNSSPAGTFFIPGT